MKPSSSSAAQAIARSIDSPPWGAMRDHLGHRRLAVDLSASSLLAGWPAGYICVTSIPTCCSSRSMRPQGGFDWVPTQVGTAIHLLFAC
jgi:hypothetical protein